MTMIHLHRMSRKSTLAAAWAMTWSVQVLVAAASADAVPIRADDSALSPSTSPLRIESKDLCVAQVGEEYANTLTVTGGTGAAITWHTAQGELPPGLALHDRRSTTQLWTGEWQATGTNPLIECSGLAASRSNPGVLWLHNDSSSGSEFYAVLEDGSIAHTYRIAGFVNEPDWHGTIGIDMEDIALGPGALDGREYLYIADFGDNLGSRTPPDSVLRLFRVVEPQVPPSGTNASRDTNVLVEAFGFTYQRTDHRSVKYDSEALLVDWDTGTPYVVTKRHGLGSGYVYKFPMPLDPSWTAENPATLILVSQDPLVLPLFPTAGDASRDAQRVVLRSYFAEAYEYYRPAGAGFDEIFSASASSRMHRFSVPAGPQHEAIGYGPDGKTLITATEGKGTEISKLSAAETARDSVVSGVPLEAGEYRFVVEARDSSGARDRLELLLTVEDRQRRLPLFMPYVLAL